MKRSGAALVRKFLRENEDGLTTREIANLTGRTVESIKHSIHKMPDVYIDRWKKVYHEKCNRLSYTAVYCAVKVPVNCPPPWQVKVESLDERRRDLRSPHVAQRRA